MNRMIVFLSVLLGLPTAQAQWTLSHLQGGFDFVMMGDTLFSTDIGRIVRSTDFGETWSSADNGVAGMSIKNFAVQGNRLYAGTEFYGVFWTSDQGAKWQQASLQRPWGPKSADLLVRDSFLFWASGVVAFSRSVDSGATWETVYAHHKFTDFAIASLHQNASYMFASGTILERHDSIYGGVLRSSDNGKSWENVSPPDFHDRGAVNNVADMAVTDDVLIAGSELFVYRSTDNGDSWQVISAGLPSVAGVQHISMRGNIAFMNTEVGIFWSSDAGLTWHDGDDDVLNEWEEGILIAGEYVFAGNGGKIWRRSISEFYSLGVQLAQAKPQSRIVHDRLTREVYIEGQENFSTVAVSDILGRALLVQEPQRLGNKQSAILPHLSSGVYFVQFKGTQEVSRKIVIQ